MKFPFLRPSPVRLSEHVDALREIEESQHFTNFGPKVRQLEAEMSAELGASAGSVLTVSNGTMGLMIAVREALETRAAPAVSADRRYAIVPSFTFAATAHALLWNQLTPLYCDVDPETWLPDPDSIEQLLAQYRDRVALLMPYATFGNGLDLAWYEGLEARTGIPVVVDAAASLGSRDVHGHQFGTGSSLVIVFSMHATKTFATAEGGLVYASDPERIERMRAISNFGFSSDRIVVMPGLNGKFPELGALLALEKHKEMPRVIATRSALASAYRAHLPAFPTQRPIGAPTFQFYPATLPSDSSTDRGRWIEAVRAQGVEVRSYFSPCLHEQAYFQARSEWIDLPVTERLSRSVSSLPLYDTMTTSDVAEIASVANACLA